MNKPATCCLILIAIFCLPLQASPLEDARAAGQVIENPDGYVRANPEGVPANVQALVDDINERRKDAYTKIAQKNGVSVTDVATESYRKRNEE